MAREPDGLTIRAAETEDIEQIASLINLPNFRFYTMRLPYSAKQTVAAWVTGSNPNRPYLVAVLQDRIVGHASLSRSDRSRRHAGQIAMGVSERLAS